MAGGDGYVPRHDGVARLQCLHAIAAHGLGEEPEPRGLQLYDGASPGPVGAESRSNTPGRRFQRISEFTAAPLVHHCREAWQQRIIDKSPHGDALLALLQEQRVRW